MMHFDDMSIAERTALMSGSVTVLERYFNSQGVHAMPTILIAIAVGPGGRGGEPLIMPIGIHMDVAINVIHTLSEHARSGDINIERDTPPQTAGDGTRCDRCGAPLPTALVQEIMGRHRYYCRACSPLARGDNDAGA